MFDFDTLWRAVVERSKSFPVVQEYHELKYIYELMRGCNSYLEVGSAEGNSLFILGQALAANAHIAYIDLDETHTRSHRERSVATLKEIGYHVCGIHGNSMHRDVVEKAQERSYDCVLIDAGHSYEEVCADAENYAPLAKKYVFFHDVCLPAVNEAFKWYVKQHPQHEAYKFINSETFGYGILRVKND